MPCPCCGTPVATGLEKLFQRVTTLEMNESGTSEDLVNLQFQINALCEKIGSIEEFLAQGPADWTDPYWSEASGADEG